MKLHFLSTTKLSDDLVNSRLSQREKVYYMLAGFVFNIIAGYSTLMLSSASRTWAGIYECFMLVVITAYGVERCFDATNEDENKSLISDFICLSLPIGVTTTFAAWAAFWAFWLLYKPLVLAAHIESQEIIKIIVWINENFYPISVLATVVISIAVFYLRIATHLKKVYRQRKAAN
jgi:hypothetical protein